MRWWQRKPNLSKAAAQIEAAEAELKRMLNNETYVPSPHDAQDIAYIRAKLRTMPTLAEEAHTECWQRVEAYVRTPYTPLERNLRRAAAFIGWWIAATLTIQMCIMGWFVGLYPSPWYALATSAALGLIAVSWVCWSERSK